MNSLEKSVRHHLWLELALLLLPERNRLIEIAEVNQYHKPSIMTAQRSRKEELNYRTYRKRTDFTVCEFCKPLPDQIVKDTREFKVLRNKFPYTIWDGQTVIDHLMIVPKTHTDTVAEFNDAMASDYFRILKEYEARGYNTYARAPSSKIKSIGHQHTHLLKTEGRAKSFVLLVRRPFYLRLVKS